VGINNEIGFQNNLLWHLPDDFKWFKKHTLGKPVIMGRKTFESIGKPLPERANIVVSKNVDKIEGTIVTDNLEEAINLAFSKSDHVFIIGGASVYEQTLPLADSVYITKVRQQFEADAFFPNLNSDDWKLYYSLFHPKDEKHAHDFEFMIWKKNEAKQIV
jgi:dihydrofolate reductase